MNESMTKPKTLLLVDGSSYLYRAFHAMPDLRALPGDPTSAPTGAIRGMINMLQSLRKEVPADFAACVFDARAPPSVMRFIPSTRPTARRCLMICAARLSLFMRWCV